MSHIWLQREIAVQLHLACAWLSSTDGTADKQLATTHPYEYSGSSLCILRSSEERYTNRLRIVQSNPLIVTDGAVSIEASLDPECEQVLSHRRPHVRFTARSYVLRYTPYGPTHHHIRLALRSIVLDSQPVATKDAIRHLKPIDLCEDVVSFAGKLRRIWIEFDRQCFGIVDCRGKRTDRMSPIPVDDEENENHPDTQTAYGTQVVHSKRTPSMPSLHGRELTTPGDDSAKTALLMGLLKKRPAARSDAPKAPSAGGFVRTPDSRVSTDLPVPPADRMQSTRLPPSYPRKNVSDEPSVSALTKSTAGDPEPDWLKNSCLADGCGKVPGAQVKLLSSWQKRRSGTNDRFPHANVPIQLFNAFKQFKLNAALSDSESSDEEGSSIGDAQSSGEPNNANGEKAIGPLSINDNDEVSDEEVDTPISWSASSTEGSPVAPFRPMSALPPDSSLPDIFMASQDEPREASPVQNAQQIALVPSLDDNDPFDIQSSLNHDHDDSDMDMELDLPRELDERNVAQNTPGTTAAAKAVTVQVKETPYHRMKASVPSPSGLLAAQMPLQTSSGTSKDTSSTSIVRGTYREPSSSFKSISQDAVTVPPRSAAHSSPYNGVHDSGGPMDVCTADVIDQTSRPSPPFDDKGQHVDLVISPSKSIAYLHSSLESERLDAQAATSPPPMAPALIPVSGQRSNSQLERNATSRAKRKSEPAAAAERVHRPLKRGKYPKYKGFGDRLPGDIAEELERERQADYEMFKRRERTTSLASKLSDSGVLPNAQSSSYTNRQGEDQLESSQTHPLVHADTSDRDLPTARDQDGSAVRSLQQTSPGSSPHDFVIVDKQRVSLIPDATLHSNQSRPQSCDPMPEVLGDVTMASDDPEASNDSVEIIAVESVETKVPVNDHEARVLDSSHPSPAQAHKSSMPSKMDLSATKPEKPKTTLHPRESAIIFERFKAAYPDYTGDSRHFLGQCKQMEKLDEQDKMVPKWQWDDFIIRNRIDYRDYANRCLDNGEDAEPYYRYYKNNIREPKYKEDIVTSRRHLTVAIEELSGHIAAKAPAPIASGKALKASKPLSTTAAIIPKPYIAKTPKLSSTSRLLSDSLGAKIPTPKAPAANVPITRTPLTSQTVAEGSPTGSVAHVRAKSRKSLPSAFQNSSGVRTSTTQTVSKEHRRPSHQNPPSRGVSSVAPSHSNRSSLPLASVNNSTSRPLQRTSSASHIPKEATGDPYRDFVFGLKRTKAFTGDDSVRSPSTWKSSRNTNHGG